MGDPLTCESIRDEFSAYLDGELAAELRAVIETHLKGCSDCLRELDGLQRVSALYGELPLERAPASFEGDVRAAVRPKIALRRATRLRRPYMPLLLAAAMLAVVVGPLVLMSQLETKEIQVARAPEMEEVLADKAAGMAKDQPADVNEFSYNDNKAREDLKKTDGDVAVERALRSPAPPPAAEAVRVQLGSAAVDEVSAEPSVLEEEGSALGNFRNNEKEVGVFDSVDDARSEGKMASGTVSREDDEVDLFQRAPTDRDRVASKAAPAELAPLKPRRQVALKTEAREGGGELRASSPVAVGGALGQFENQVANLGQSVAAFADDGQLGQRRVGGVAGLEIAGGGRDEGLRMKDKTASQLQSLEYLGDGTSGEALLTRKIGERSFALHGKVWRQVEYKNEETEKFFRGSRQLRRLEANNPELRPILGLGDHVVFQFDDTWYEVRPED